MELIDNHSILGFMIACDACQELFVMFHQEHWDFFSRPYSVVQELKEASESQTH